MKICEKHPSDMASTHEDAVNNFDLNFFLCPANDNVAQSRADKKRKDIKHIKEKIIAVDSLIKQCNAAKEVIECYRKDLSDSREECIQTAKRHQVAVEQTAILQKKVDDLATKHKEMKNKSEETQNREEGEKVLNKQYKLLLDERDCQIDILKKQLNKEKDYSKFQRRQITKLSKIINFLGTNLCNVADVVFRARKLNKNEKRILYKYMRRKRKLANTEKTVCEKDYLSIGHEDSELSDDDKSSEQEVNMEKDKDKMLNFLELEQDTEKGKHGDESDVGSEIVSEDTGRGSSLSNNYKCLNSPDYFDSNQLCTGEANTKKIDAATSPITVEETNEVATSPILFENSPFLEYIGKTPNIQLSVKEKRNSSKKIMIDQETSPMKPGLTSEFEISNTGFPHNDLLDGIVPIKEKNCLELTNSIISDDENSNDGEISKILNNMRCRDIVTPIPSTPRRCVTAKSNDEHPGDTILIEKKIDILLSKVTDIASALAKRNMRSAIESEDAIVNNCMAYENPPNKTATNSVHPPEQDLEEEIRFVIVEQEEEIESEEHNSAKEPIEPSPKLHFEMEAQYNVTNDDDKHEVDMQTENVGSSCNKVRVSKPKKLTKLEKLRRNLIPRSKIKKAEQPLSKKYRNINRKLISTDTTEINNKCSYNKEKMEEAVKLIAEFNAKQKRGAAKIVNDKRNRFVKDVKVSKSDDVIETRKHAIGVVIEDCNSHKTSQNSLRKELFLQNEVETNKSNHSKAVIKRRKSVPEKRTHLIKNRQKYPSCSFENDLVVVLNRAEMEYNIDMHLRDRKLPKSPINDKLELEQCTISSLKDQYCGKSEPQCRQTRRSRSSVEKSEPEQSKPMLCNRSSTYNTHSEQTVGKPEQIARKLRDRSSVDKLDLGKLEPERITRKLRDRCSVDKLDLDKSEPERITRKLRDRSSVDKLDLDKSEPERITRKLRDRSSVDKLDLDKSEPERITRKLRDRSSVDKLDLDKSEPERITRKLRDRCSVDKLDLDKSEPERITRKLRDRRSVDQPGPEQSTRMLRNSPSVDNIEPRQNVDKPEKITRNLRSRSSVDKLDLDQLEPERITRKLRDRCSMDQPGLEQSTRILRNSPSVDKPESEQSLNDNGLKQTTRKRRRHSSVDISIEQIVDKPDQITRKLRSRSSVDKLYLDKPEQEYSAQKLLKHSVDNFEPDECTLTLRNHSSMDNPEPEHITRKLRNRSSVDKRESQQSVDKPEPENMTRKLRNRSSVEKLELDQILDKQKPQQSSRTMSNRSSVDKSKPDQNTIQSKRLLNKLELKQSQQALSSSSRNSLDDNAHIQTNYDHFDTKYSPELVSYDDLDIYSDEPISLKRKCEGNSYNDDKCSPPVGLLCKMIEKYGITTIKINAEKTSESSPNSTSNFIEKKIEEGIAHILEVPEMERIPAMNKLVVDIQKWQPKDFLSGFMKYLMNESRHIEFLSKVHRPPSPPMTKQEWVLLYIVFNLNGWSNVNITQCILNKIEHILFKLNSTPGFNTVECISHFYALLCRRTDAKSRLRCFMLGAMYCIQYKSAAVIRQCLEVWMLILPLGHMGIAKSPLVTCLVYLLHFYKCEENGHNRFQKIRTILTKTYNYDCYKWTESNILEMFKSAILDLKDSPLERKMLRLALIIFAKRQGPMWCQNKIVHNLLQPLIRKDGVSESTKAFCVSIQGPLMKPYPLDMRIDCEVAITEFIEMLDNNPSDMMKEAIYTSLIYLKKHNQNRVLKILHQWEPKQVTPEFEEVLKDFVREKTVGVWKKILPCALDE